MVGRVAAFSLDYIYTMYRGNGWLVLQSTGFGLPVRLIQRSSSFRVVMIGTRIFYISSINDFEGKADGNMSIDIPLRTIQRRASKWSIPYGVLLRILVTASEGVSKDTPFLRVGDTIMP